MTTNALVHVARNRAFFLKYVNPAINIVRNNWKGIMGHGSAVGGALYLESVFSDDDLGDIAEQQMGHQLSDDEKDYAVQTIKDAADDFMSDDVFTPFSKRLNEYIVPTHTIIDMQTGKTWVTNNYISPNYVKAIRRNTVSRGSTYRRKR